MTSVHGWSFSPYMLNMRRWIYLMSISSHNLNARSLTSSLAFPYSEKGRHGVSSVISDNTVPYSACEPDSTKSRHPIFFALRMAAIVFLIFSFCISSKSRPACPVPSQARLMKTSALSIFSWSFPYSDISDSILVIRRSFHRPLPCLQTANISHSGTDSKCAISSLPMKLVAPVMT